MCFGKRRPLVGEVGQLGGEVGGLPAVAGAIALAGAGGGPMLSGLGGPTGGAEGVEAIVPAFGGGKRGGRAT